MEITARLLGMDPAAVTGLDIREAKYRFGRSAGPESAPVLRIDGRRLRGLAD